MMKRFLITYFLFLIPFLGYCDFSDYWIVQINDSTIYDSRTDKEKWNRTFGINISELELTANDTLIIRHQTDTPCPDCEYNLLFTNTRKEKIGLYNLIGESEFKFTKEELISIIKEKTEIIYFRTDQEFMRRILFIY